MKICSTCKEARDESEFNKLATAPDGLQYRCRRCSRLWYEANRDEHKRNVTRRKREGKKVKVCCDCSVEHYGRYSRCDQCQRLTRKVSCPSCGLSMDRRAKTCRNCSSQAGHRNGNWKKGEYLDSKGYVLKRVEDSYKMEHRLVMEAHLGRPLLDTENVHHKNGVRDDNRLSNLELWAKPQPVGCRAIDLLEWAEQIVSEYKSLAEAGKI